MLNLFRKKTKVILDTNFLLIPGEFGVDVFSEVGRVLDEPYEICVMNNTLEELQALISKSNKQESFNAKLGFIMAKQKSLKTLRGSSEGYADKAILEKASESPEKTVVATQDKALREKLKKLGVRTIILKQKKYLALG